MEHLKIEQDEGTHLSFLKCFLGSSAGRESTCNAGDVSSIPRPGRSAWGRDSLPAPGFLDFLGGQMVKNLPAMWES